MAQFQIDGRFLARPGGEPEPFMGEVKVDAVLENDTDRELVHRGLLDPEQVRSVTTKVIVDTGATMLSLPQDMTEALGLRTKRKAVVRYADGRLDERPVAGPVSIRVADREATVDCIVGPPKSEALLGQIVLEYTDLLVDCVDQRLVPRPDSPFIPTVNAMLGVATA